MDEWTEKYKGEIYVTEVCRIRCFSCGNREEVLFIDDPESFEMIGNNKFKCNTCNRKVEGKTVKTHIIDYMKLDYFERDAMESLYYYKNKIICPDMASFLEEKIHPNEVALCLEDGYISALFVELTSNDELKHLSDVLENEDLKPVNLILRIKPSIQNTNEIEISLRRLRELTSEYDINLEVR